jgi:hypothetical protein
VAVNDNPRDDAQPDPPRDPQLARLLAAASREEPPAALDAAILAAARREVNARPQAADGGAHPKVAAAAPGGGGETGTPPRAKRNWYVPVSIAAVLVLSVSLVTLVHQEKGDELAQPPVATGPLPKASAPVAEPPAAKPDTALRDATTARPTLAEEKRADAATVAKPPAPEAYAELARKQRAGKLEAPADSAVVLPGTAHKEQAAGVVTRERGPVGATADAQPGEPGAALGGLSAGTRSPAAAAPARERRAEPFPAVVGEREAPAPATSPPPATVGAPVQARRDALASRARSEEDRNLARGTVQEAPVASAAPAPAARPAPALRQMAQRAVLWRGLEDQPPEKWLERLAEFKRDNRQADADELLAEFRRRFPDHPASAR